MTGRAAGLAALILLAGGASLSSGCTGSSDDQEPPRPSPTVTFDGRDVLGTWGTDPATAQADRKVWLRFRTNGAYEGFDGCNSISGRWSLDRLSGGIELNDSITTLVACPGIEPGPSESLVLDGDQLTYRPADDGPLRTLLRRAS